MLSEAILTINAIFRRAEISDLEQILDVAIETRSVRWMQPDMTLNELRSIYSSFFSGEFQAMRELYVASLGGVVLGFLAMVIGQTRAHLSCAVRNDMASRGIGRRLVLLAVDSAANPPFNEFNAVCSTENIAACRTLSACGFNLRGPWPKDPDNCLEYYRLVE
ncbi:N-acetyltransferase family protein [Methylorubrum populi]